MIALIQPPQPAAAAAPEPAAGPQPAVVSRSEATDIVQSRDLPMVLVKAARREDAVLRQAVFVASVVTVVRPPEATDAAQDRYRWAFKAYQQRQLCLTSVTGLFMCAEPEVEALPQTVEGEAALSTEGAYPLAESARNLLTASLKARATALFDTAKALQVQPLLRAAGVTTSAR